jgi:transcriptional regulator with XRE-family HTH domain
MAKPSANDIDQLLGLRLKKCRQQMGLSAAALAEAMGSTQQQISRYENGHNKLSAAQLYLLASHLGVPVSWFFMDLPTEVRPQDQTREPQAPSYVAAYGGFDYHHLALHKLADDTANMQALWPRLTAGQRTALLRLLDAMFD